MIQILPPTAPRGPPRFSESLLGPFVRPQARFAVFVLGDFDVAADNGNNRLTGEHRLLRKPHERIARSSVK